LRLLLNFIKNTMKQIIISLIAKAGGARKTKLATHLAWALNKEKISDSPVGLTNARD
jgi:hypothetical protein